MPVTPEFPLSNLPIARLEAHTGKNTALTMTLLEYATVTVRTLETMTSSIQIPFLEPIVTGSLLIFEGLNTAKPNATTKAYLRIVDLIHQFECLLISTCLTVRYAPVEMLSMMGKFAEALQKIHGCLRSHQQLGKIKLFFKQNEVALQLQKCENEVRGTLETFKSGAWVNLCGFINAMEVDAAQRHRDVLLMLEEYNGSEYSSSVGGGPALSQ
ncbi:hypothetical protein B0H13DRAFT_1891569 [Mycena leptocephala]|nr:hypothetical protein B0H13DRAFT_1891569 [Mycena leptocephala]